MSEKPSRKCTVENCEEKHYAKGLCRKHYFQKYFRSEKGKEAKNKYSKSEKKKETQKEYLKSEKGKEVQKKYLRSEKRKETQKEYRKSEKGKEVKREAQKKYRKSEKGREAQREAQKKYLSTPKGKDVLSSSRHRYRTRKFNGKYQKFSSLDIFERDNWTCQICGEEIFSELKHPHHFSASIDHIVPLSKGGVHSPENVQAAHLICNIRKGNRAD